MKPGTRPGPYEIIEPLGAGGMGEVYLGGRDRAAAGGGQLADGVETTAVGDTMIRTQIGAPSPTTHRPPRTLPGRLRGVTLALLAAASIAGCGRAPELASVTRGEAAAFVLIRDVRVFDGVDVLADRDVLAEGSRIKAVAPGGTLTPPGPGGLEIDGAGLTLLPGLIDSHAHLFSAGEKAVRAPAAEATARAFLFAGVTSVLVAAGPGEATAIRAGQRDGSLLAPHLFTAGPSLTAPEGHPIPLLRAMLPWPVRWLAVRSVPTASNEQEARVQVARIIQEHQPDFVKIIYDDLPRGSAHLSRAALEGAVTEARARGVRPIVHATAPQDELDAIQAGAAALMHLPQKGVISETDAERVAASGIPVVTTVRLLSASHDLARTGPIPLEEQMHGRRLLQPWIDEPRWELPGFSEELDRIHDQAAADTEENFRRLLAAGARLLVGTDSGVHGVFPGSSLHREMRLLVRLGMSPVAVLRAATSVPATFLSPDGTVGRIAPGQRADLLLVRGDPTENIDALAQIEAVFLGGQRLRRIGL